MGVIINKMKMKMKIKIIIVAVLSLLLFASCQSGENNNSETNSTTQTQTQDEPDITKEIADLEKDIESDTKLLYQGHGSFRIISKNGTVVYIDPYAGEGYDVPADIILVTHQHDDHNKINLVAKKDDCAIFTNKDAIENGKHMVVFTDIINFPSVTIEAVEAKNKNHDPKNCVGYIITVDGIKIYMAGDTSKTEQMNSFAEKEIDYAFLPCDGIYNMDVKEAAECAEIIGAKHNIPMHTKPGALFDREIAESCDMPNRLIIEAGEEIVLAR